ncbi:rho-related GTP-binding protein RhoF-like [Scleropages formosus]|uniref:Rho-related GTP-binding protein RhoF-like n=1 Tax=Scleropages formosus TaxID=113540 RepID=A0A0P7U396_SCLFO|nr:rho-related GTP-binding protein RhoF-like [Scleropages formosus]
MTQKVPGGRSGSSPQREEVNLVIVGDGGCGKTSLLMVYAKGRFPEKYAPSVFEKFATSVTHGGREIGVTLYDTAGQEDYDRLRPLSYNNANLVLICYDVTSPTSFDNVLIKVPSSAGRVPNPIGAAVSVATGPRLCFLRHGYGIRVTWIQTARNDATLTEGYLKEPRKGYEFSLRYFRLLNIWYPEVHHFCPGVPILLIGCKTDLRKDKERTRRLRSLGQAPITYLQGEETKHRINAELYLECSAKYQENVDDIFREAVKRALAASRKVHKKNNSCVVL